MSLPTTMQMNPRFLHALYCMEKTDASVFITGKAGTGKSTLLSHFCATTRKKPVVLAPTGVAALNVKGQTIHKFFNFYIDVTPDKIRRRQIKPRNPKLYKKITTIIIDEVSMVRADLLDCIDAFLRLYGPKDDQPFGGVQMIFVGDLYQLPPVVSAAEQEIFESLYDTPYFFSAHALREAEMAIVELDRVYRQKEQEFVELLNRIRTDTLEAGDIAALNRRYLPGDGVPETGGFSISLTATNSRADAINAAHLEALPGKVYCATAVVDGTFTKEYFPTATELRFKKGAQVMLVNNDSAQRWVNGSIGVIETLARDEDGKPYAQVRLEDDGGLVTVTPHRWEVYKFAVAGDAIISEPVGSFTQFPFRLAWAVTIHKSQGKTFSQVVIDIDRGTFASGQMYVALSRCTTFEGIVLKTPVQPQHIRTDPRIVAFMEQHPYLPLPEAAMAEMASEYAQQVEQVSSSETVQQEYAQAHQLVHDLARGIDPFNGQLLAEDGVYNTPQVRKALATLLAELDAARAAPAPLAKKAKSKAARDPAQPARHGKAWAAEEKEQAGNWYREGIAVAEIATRLERTRGSIRSELIKQGLIEPYHATSVEGMETA